MWLSNFHLVSSLLVLNFIKFSSQDSVSTSDACREIDNYFTRGCSELTAKLLGKKFKTTNQYRQGGYIGTNGQYNNVSPGDLVGFPDYPGHVAIYVGNSGCRCMFIDVPAPNRNARCLATGYGRNQRVYKYYY